MSRLGLAGLHGKAQNVALLRNATIRAELRVHEDVGAVGHRDEAEAFRHVEALASTGARHGAR